MLGQVTYHLYADTGAGGDDLSGHLLPEEILFPLQQYLITSYPAIAATLKSVHSDLEL